MYQVIEFSLLAVLGFSSLWALLGKIAPKSRMSMQSATARWLSGERMPALVRTLAARMQSQADTSCGSGGCNSCGSCGTTEAAPPSTVQPVKIYCSTKARSIT